MKEYVVGFMFTADSTQVALILKNRPSWQAGYYNGIGGKIEEDDASPAAAMAREFFEETGLATKAENWRHFCTLDVQNTAFIHCFCLQDNAVLHIKTCTDETVKLHPTAHLPKNMLFNLKWLIPLALDANLPATNPIMVPQVPQK